MRKKRGKDDGRGGNDEVGLGGSARRYNHNLYIGLDMILYTNTSRVVEYDLYFLSLIVFGMLDMEY